MDKNEQFSFLWEHFHIPCQLLISRLNGDGFIANETRIQTVVPLAYLHVGLHIVSDALAGKAYYVQRCWKTQYRSLPQILVGLLYSRCEICMCVCVCGGGVFLSSAFLLLPIFSSFSNNAARHDLPNRQSVSPVRPGPVRSGQVKSGPVRSGQVSSVSQSLSQSIQNVSQTWALPPYLLVVMSKILWVCGPTFYAIICYNDIKYTRYFVKFRVLQIPISETNVRIVFYLFITQFLQRP